MALRTLTTIDLIHFIMREDRREWKFIEIAFGWGPVTYGFTLQYMMVEVCWDGLWTLSFGLSQFHGHNSWLVCEVTLISCRPTLTYLSSHMWVTYYHTRSHNMTGKITPFDIYPHPHLILHILLGHTIFNSNQSKPLTSVVEPLHLIMHYGEHKHLHSGYRLLAP